MKTSPKKVESASRNKVIRIVVNDREHQEIRRRADRARVSMSSFCRSAVLGGERR